MIPRRNSSDSSLFSVCDQVECQMRHCLFSHFEYSETYLLTLLTILLLFAVGSVHASQSISFLFVSATKHLVVSFDYLNFVCWSLSWTQQRIGCFLYYFITTSKAFEYYY